MELEPFELTLNFLPNDFPEGDIFVLFVVLVFVLIVDFRLKKLAGSMRFYMRLKRHDSRVK